MQRTKTSVNPFGLPNIVIPAEALFNDRITWREKALFGFLLNLAYNEKGYCWASNKYLGHLLGTRPDTASGMISKLQKEKYIIVEHETREDDFLGTKQVRKIMINEQYPQIHAEMLKQAFGKSPNPVGEITKTPWGNDQNPLGKTPKSSSLILKLMKRHKQNKIKIIDSMQMCLK